MKPVIGISSGLTEDEGMLKLNINYCNAVSLAGGIPLVLPYGSCLNTIRKMVNGFILTGGGDINPLLFGQQPLNELGRISPLRDKYELELAKYALKSKKAILGICRGCQVLSIASGGSVYQDIGNITTIKHSQNAPNYYPTHEIILKKDTILYDIYKAEKINVNSFHHQAIEQPGKDFFPSAQCEDGIIEAIESQRDRFAIGVQWHPEEMFKVLKIHLKLFEHFVKAAGES